MNWRKQIRRELKEEVIKHHLIKFTFSKFDLTNKNISLQFIKKDEFRYNNQMYDIVEKIESKDSVTYVCYHDIKEMLQVSALMNIAMNSGFMTQAVPLLKSIILENQYYISFKELFKPDLSLLFLDNKTDSFTFINCVIEVITPPPKLLPR